MPVFRAVLVGTMWLPLPPQLAMVPVHRPRCSGGAVFKQRPAEACLPAAASPPTPQAQVGLRPARRPARHVWRDRRGGSGERGGGMRRAGSAPALRLQPGRRPLPPVEPLPRLLFFLPCPTCADPRPVPHPPMCPLGAGPAGHGAHRGVDGPRVFAVPGVPAGQGPGDRGGDHGGCTGWYRVLGASAWGLVITGRMCCEAAWLETGVGW